MNTNADRNYAVYLQQSKTTVLVVFMHFTTSYSYINHKVET